jgi:carbon-monoxide dehydrogenase small subunit
MDRVQIKLVVNSKEFSLSILPNRTLLDILREDIGLTGTKRGCEIGECGACTVIMDGEAANSCLVLATQADGSEILTVEGLMENDKLHPLQQSFIDHDAVHCGFCTPGMLMSAYALLKENDNPTENDIRLALAGNLCRCTGYQQIIEAVQKVKLIEKKQ